MNHEAMRDALCELGAAVRERVRRSLFESTHEERSRVHKEEAEDTIYEIDRHVEDILAGFFERRAGPLGGVILIAEGVGEEEGGIVFPNGLPAEKAAWRVLADPIDGTRGIMYDKRSAFFLAGAAPNRGTAARLQDIEAAAMVELPTSRCALGDTLWAIRGRGAARTTLDLREGREAPAPISPSRAKSILGGFAQISRFFPGGKEILAGIEEELISRLFPDMPKGRGMLFEDQYISTGGQLYEMLVGHDRFVADLRGGLGKRLVREGRPPCMTCHPYDAAAHLIGAEAGLIVTDRHGNPLDAPMDVTSAVDWIAYANPAIRAEVEPVLQQCLKDFGVW